MSSSTPWMISRTARRSSSRAVSLPMAAAVGTDVRITGRFAVSAAAMTSSGTVARAVTSTQGTFISKDFASANWRPAGGRVSRKRNSLSP